MDGLAAMQGDCDEGDIDRGRHAEERSYLDFAFYARLEDVSIAKSIVTAAMEVQEQHWEEQQQHRWQEGRNATGRDVPALPICLGSRPGNCCWAVRRRAQRPTWCITVTDSLAQARTAAGAAWASAALLSREVPLLVAMRAEGGGGGQVGRHRGVSRFSAWSWTAL